MVAQTFVDVLWKHGQRILPLRRGVSYPTAERGQP
jgi:hypothetical protein